MSDQTTCGVPDCTAIPLDYWWVTIDPTLPVGGWTFRAFCTPHAESERASDRAALIYIPGSDAGADHA
jgi:hypothetical protein